MLRTYLILIVVAGVFGSMMSTCSSRLNSVPSGTFETRSPRLDDRALETDTRRESSSSGMSRGIELERSANGHFYADVEINGVPVHALVDTGASGIALSRDDARRAGLAISAGMFDVVGEGADGDVHGEHVRLDRVSLGSTTAQDLPAIVLDSGDTTLLGQSFLSKFESVEIRGDRMALR
jgi:aspartyl protease family protein